LAPNTSGSSQFTRAIGNFNSTRPDGMFVSYEIGKKKKKLKFDYKSGSLQQKAYGIAKSVGTIIHAK
jgi:hypothetical protein